MDFSLCLVFRLYLINNDGLPSASAGKSKKASGNDKHIYGKGCLIRKKNGYGCTSMHK